MFQARVGVGGGAGMKDRVTLAAVLLIVFASGDPTVASQTQTSSRTAQIEAKPFLGKWDMTVKTPNYSYPSWLEIYEAGDELTAMFVGRTDHAIPLPAIAVSNGSLRFTAPADGHEKGEFKAKLLSGSLQGTVSNTDGTLWTWVGKRAPTLHRSDTPHWGKPETLFSGKDLIGWHESASDGTAARHWSVADAELVSPGRGPDLISDRKFGDFKLHVEFKCGPNSNSGVYLRGRYEVQIENDSAAQPSSHHTGAVYGFLAPEPELLRTTDQWQILDITLIGRNVTIVQNGTTIIDHKDIPGITGGALDSQEGGPGPIYLQGGEIGKTTFRNIVITTAIDEKISENQRRDEN